jgi:hypothetical protein
MLYEPPTPDDASSEEPDGAGGLAVASRGREDSPPLPRSCPFLKTALVDFGRRAGLSGRAAQ